MNKRILVQSIILALSLLCFISCQAQTNNLTDYRFDDYLQEFNKTYSGSHYYKHKQTFEKNLASIIEFNSRKNTTYMHGINNFTDQNWTDVMKAKIPFNHKRGMNKKSTNNFLPLQDSPFLEDVDVTKLPKSVDWSKMSTPVKNQGWCQSCWAFSTTEVIETHLNINTGKLIELSEQELVSCMQYDRKCENCGGCLPDDPEEAFIYTQKNGLTSETLYPYVQADDSETRACTYNTNEMKKVVKIEGYRKIENITSDQMMYLIANHGPISAAVDMQLWQDYKSGVFSGCDSQENISLNHAISIEGYGTDEEFGDYWLIRNSYTEYWGDKGYMKLKRDKEFLCKPSQPDWGFVDGQLVMIYSPPICGQCGIQAQILYPVGVQLVESTSYSAAAPPHTYWSSF